jgi:hypothetical protein
MIANLWGLVFGETKKFGLFKRSAVQSATEALNFDGFVRAKDVKGQASGDQGILFSVVGEPLDLKEGRYSLVIGKMEKDWSGLLEGQKILLMRWNGISIQAHGHPLNGPGPGCFIIPPVFVEAILMVAKNDVFSNDAEEVAKRIGILV